VPGPVLFLGRADSPVLAYLRARDDVIALGPSEPIAPELRARIAVSHGYRLILRGDVLERLPAINLHIAYLPYNRGADPTLWSVLDGTPAGVTIHHVDEGVDTGDLIARRRVALDDPQETLATAYAKLQDAMAVLFKEQWPAIAAGTAPREPQPPGGTGHRIADRAAVEHLLTHGWDTPLAALRGLSATSAPRRS
jgi:methionyl-tRNA formyltransferase